jgi:polygalacturonase
MRTSVWTVIVLIAAASGSLSCTKAAKAPEQAGKPAAVKSVEFPVQPAKTPEKVFDVRSYGAVGDGATDDGPAIQKAIDDANSTGGGMVLLSGGTFLSGPLTLGSNMDLRIRAGTILKALPMDRYPLVNGKHPDFMVAQRAHDLRLSGEGTIDGQGEPWWTKFESKVEMPGRPRLIYLSRTDRVLVTGLHIQNAPTFHLVLNNTNDVTVNGVTITADGESPNTDGIDVRGVSTFITNCSIAVGDDNVAIGSPSSKVKVTHCKFGVGHGLSIGSYTRAGVSDVYADHVTFDGTVTGIQGKSQRGRGGLVENLRYSNITMTNVKHPIWFHSYYETKPKDPNTDTFEPVAKMTPIWRNATFTNIRATAPEKRYGIVLWGLPEMPVENFTFNHVSVVSPRGNQLFHVKDVSFSDDCSFEATDSGVPFDIADAANVRMPDGKVCNVPMKKSESAGK